MDEHQAVLNYLWLAVLSDRKRQVAGRDRLLILAADAACHGGLLGLAESCRDLVVTDEPHHLLAKFESFAAAARDEGVLTFLKQVRKACPPEQAEFLVEKHADKLSELRRTIGGDEAVEPDTVLKLMTGESTD